ncbi:hypothetical protein Pla175_18860 [Pirellulimonas nuda]|uniref:Carboxypeptidase regulatory-like domain-containing protein n=1 Tax=Pirellulimonas nuda TaxID=2528009 RepID=A0A518DAM2_9BACT|nr:hypothetical protein [Pirellulimonas nuda]QDU88508.1 hypothetical protein Pla175_18860 [Pirellulimonas nuda]
MFNHPASRASRISSLLGLGFAVCGCVGCGSDMAPVAGRVEFSDGSPVRGGIRVIRFEPDDDSPAEVRKAGSGDIAEDGSFVITTKKPGDGVYRGKYVVTFTVISDRESAKSLIPSQYTTYVDSPFEVTVDRGKSDYLFKLEKPK